jgi:xanthine dehydrogenase small subunit
MPVLLSLDSTVVLRRGHAVREIPLGDFYIAYQKTALAAGEFVVAVRIPQRPANLLLRAYKVSKRFDQDISAAFICIALTMDGARIQSARIGCGGVAPTPTRAPRTEALLAGRLWDDTTADAASRLLRDEFTPIDDMRASAAYRRTVLGNLLRRMHLETGRNAPDAQRIVTRVADVAATIAAMAP